MATKVLTAKADVLRGSVRVSASGVPSGHARVTRAERRIPELIRGGEFDVSTGGFIKEDPEPPFGNLLTYRVSLEPTNRNIQTNRVLNPKAKTATTNWTVGSGRTLTRDTAPVPAVPRDATTAFQIGPRSQGAGTITERTLMSTVPSVFGAGRWFISGQMKYDSPDAWLWLDVKNNGTWNALKTKTWNQVRSTYSVEADQPFASLWCAVLSPTDTTVVAPFQIIGASVVSQGNWLTFQGWVDVPVGVPAGSRLVFLHGSAVREYATTFWLTTLMVTPEAEMTAGALPYFDGDTLLPANPAANLVPGYDWFPVTSDASIVWNGTNGNSVSVFTGPSTIAAEDTVTIGVPGQTLLPRVKKPVLLSDPVVPQLSVWFELLAIGPLSRKARADLYDVLGRGPQIAVSQKRAWPSGEFRFLTHTLEEESIADRLFDSGRILFFRNPDPRHPESSWYLHIGDVAWSRVGDQFADKPERIWSVPFVRVERPVGLIAASGSITWADIKANYTWDELRTKTEDWLDGALVIR